MKIEERRKEERRKGLCIVHSDMKAMVDELRKAIVGRWVFNLVMGFIVSAFLFAGYALRDVYKEMTVMAVNQAKLSASVDTIIMLFKSKME